MEGAVGVANVTAGDKTYEPSRASDVGDTVKAYLYVRNREGEQALRGLTLNWWVDHPSDRTAFVHLRWTAPDFNQVDDVASVTSDTPFRLEMKGPDGILKSSGVDGKYSEQWVEMSTGRIAAPTVVATWGRDSLTYSVLLLVVERKGA